MSKLSCDTFMSRLGEMFCAVQGDGAVVHLCFLNAADASQAMARAQRALARHGHSPSPGRGSCAPVRRQIDEFLSGRRREFDLELRPDGTEFQRAVWDELRRIPYGETITYRELAARIGKPSAVRAVGRANATNPISLAIPCHRVIGVDGSLTGFGGGLDVKRALLTFESRGSTFLALHDQS